LEELFEELFKELFKELFVELFGGDLDVCWLVEFILRHREGVL
jgi:hypothetical protein